MQAKTIQAKTIQDYVSGIKRRKGTLASVFLLLLSCSIALAVLLPAEYQSTATILIEQQDIPQDLVRTTVTSFADQRIQEISQRVMIRPNILGIINKFDLYETDRDDTPTEELVERMRDNINLEMISADVVDPRSGRPTQATIAFTLSFNSKYPALAQKVTNELATLFLKDNIKSRTQMATDTTSFLKDESNKLNLRINDLESSLAKFKEENAGSLPDLVQLNLNLLDRTDRDISSIDAEIRSLKERRIYLGYELTTLSRSNQLFSDNGQRIFSPDDRLKMLETKLVSMKATYQEGHPSLVRIQREINALKADSVEVDATAVAAERIQKLRVDLSKAKNKYTKDHPDVTRLSTELKLMEDLYGELVVSSEKTTKSNSNDNPAYTQLKAQLEAINSELKSMQEKKNDLYSRRDLYEDRISRAPQVERGFRRLTRDYDNAWIKYKEITAKLMEAQLAEVLESERKGERFTLIEPPQLPETPQKPNRMMIVLLGIVISFGAGLGSTAFMESIDTRIYGRNGVASAMLDAPLAVIPYIDTEMDQRALTIKAMYMTLILIGGGLLILAIIQYFVVPLDVAWFIAMRKFGISI